MRVIIPVALLMFPSLLWAFRPGEPDKFSERLVQAVIERTSYSVTYDGSYRRMSYPGGDVSDDIGVCTDVVIRSYRMLGIDLQKDVHEDMKANFHQYPKTWGLTRPDTNIDHRRVPNLQTLFKRKGTVLNKSGNPKDYMPGDLVTWMLPGNLPHIGIVINRKSGTTGNPLIAHNIGQGPEIEDMLFRYPITGHYRYYGGLK